jgi:hypothetical protein
MKKYHYVYKITNLKPQDQRKFYIGVRSSNCLPKDDHYWSSSKYLKEAIKDNGYNNFKKEILSIWESRKLALTEEIRLHELYDVSKNPQYYNRSKQTSSGWDTTGEVTVRDKNTGETKNIKLSEFNDNYEYLTVGKMTVFDTRDNLTKMVLVDDYNKCDYYLSTTKNLVTVLKDGNYIKVTKEEYYSNPDLKSPISGTVSVIDKRDNTKKRVSKEDFEIFDYYESTRFVRVKFYNNFGEYQFTNDCQIDDFMKSKNMPINAFKQSYKHNGQRVYRSLDDSNPRKTDIVKKGWYHYKDWYALKE